MNENNAEAVRDIRDYEYYNDSKVNTYNYDGQRISKTDNGVTTNYYYQGGVPLYTTDGTVLSECEIL